ncbi:MAG: hypothetical protein M1426_02625 [Patescibacteria group bacterium]|nr:hypothetical protein [Patescibacteria group bacterium]
MFFDPIYVLVTALVLGINVMPMFMPPTWMVLAFFYTQYNLTLLPLVILGATAATSGRILLFLLSKSWLRRIIPQRFLVNYNTLGNYFQNNTKLTIPVVLLYAFSPIPSNQVFVIAGLAKLNIKIIAFSFLAGRLISYTFWVSVASHVASHLETVFASRFNHTNSYIMEVLGVILIIVIGKINWRKVLKIKESE